MERFTDNFWNTFDATKYDVFGLKYIRICSYYRYSPPKRHDIYLFLSLFLLATSSMIFFSIINRVGLTFYNYPKSHKTLFWICEVTFFLSGLVIIPYWRKLDKISLKNWKEMEDIRKKIDIEISKHKNK